MKRITLRAAAIIALGMATGCGLNTQPQPLLSSQFVRSRPAVGPDGIGQPVGQSGALAYGHLHNPLLPDEYSNLNPVPLTEVPPVVSREIPAPGVGAGATTAPALATTAPATQPNPGAPGGFQWVGTVVAVVNDTPIYADKVLASLEHELGAEAHKFGPDMFRQIARQDIEAKVQELVHNQLEVAKATTSLNEESKTQAQLYAQAWRQQQIIAANGSLELAKQRALESGIPLEEQVRDQYHSALVQIYYSQRVIPRIQVTPADLRRYYDAHVDTEFTRHAEAKFRLIRIDFTRSGGAEQAAKKAEEIIKQLKGGADFADLARKFSDDEFSKPNGGDVGWVAKDNYRVEKIEQAVWAMQPGEFTDHPIEVTDSNGTAFYLVQLEARKLGVVRPFDNPDVQKQVYEKLFSQQLAVLREKELQALVEQAVIFREPNGVDTAVDMAMQRYPVWAAAR